MISVTFCLAKSRHFYHISLYMSMCIFVCFFLYINNTAKGNTSLMLNKLLLLLLLYFKISSIDLRNPVLDYRHFF